MLWQNWITKRFQFKAEKQLTQKDVLVFIYQQGYLYLVLIFITFIAGVNYANNLILAFCFLISAVLCMSFYLTFKQLHGLSIDLVLPEIGQVESALQLQMHFKQHHSQRKQDAETVNQWLLRLAQEVKPEQQALFKQAADYYQQIRYFNPLNAKNIQQFKRMRLIEHANSVLMATFTLFLQ
jgi:hypothetical protein